MNDFPGTIYATFSYGLMFTVTLVFIRKAENNLERNKLKSVLFALVGICVPCLFAAFRAETVGTDVLVYAKPYYLSALKVNSFSSYLLNGSAEIGYEFMVYFVTKIFGSFSSVLFFTELLVLLPIYCVLKDNRESISIANGFFVYLCIFYIGSLNFMRQSIAASMLLLAFDYYINKHKIKAVIISFLAVLFHYTVILGIFFILFAGIYYSINSKFTRGVFLTSFIIVFVVVYSGWQSIIDLSISIGLLPSRFQTYVALFSGEVHSSAYRYYFYLSKSNYIELLFRICCFLIPALCSHNKLIRSFAPEAKTNKSMAIYNTSKVISFLSVMIYVSSFIIFHTSYACRITWYTEFFFIFYIGQCCSAGRVCLNGSRLRIDVGTIILYLFLILYWYIGYMLLGWHGTLPLSFSFSD